jgi:hypothetical protein
MSNIIIPKTRPKEDTAFWDGIERSIRLGLNKEKVLAEQRQRETARYEAMIPRQTVDGLGQLTAVIDLQTYLRWHHYQPGCWNDKKFGKEFVRDNPAVRAARPERKYI